MINELLLVDKEIKNLLEDKSDYPDSGLYHYTNIAGLNGTLFTRKLWMKKRKKRFF